MTHSTMMRMSSRYTKIWKNLTKMNKKIQKLYTLIPNLIITSEVTLYIELTRMDTGNVQSIKNSSVCTLVKKIAVYFSHLVLFESCTSKQY